MKNKSFILLILFVALGAFALNATPKREMRSAWVATVWALDWPNNSGSWTTDPAKQQALLVQLLDSMQRMNMNCVALQGRTMSDAFYESKYEPWSQWLTGTRGGEPTYDPMKMAIEEAHKRGMELHVWINPYRYASSEAQYNTNKALPFDYANTHPEWLMTYSGATILNPGLPEVKTRICEIVVDILEKYDVDGILFDDYFYLSGTPMSMDADLYNKNNPNGLSQADWRREQVNEMVSRVQDTILVTKPWVTFGIGPAPQVASDRTHADKYGVPQGPYSDWQYNGIYSDPLAWMSRRTIDYISPQMYWHVGSGTCDFRKLSEWWSMIAEKYGRHFYASHSVEDSKAAETIREVEVLREDDMIDAPGSVLYSIRKGIFTNRSYTATMRQVWSQPALPPMKWWRKIDRQLFVSNIKYSTYTLSWEAPVEDSNVRYAVYYLPQDSIGKQGQFYSSQYLLGMTYETSYKVPLKQGWQYAVSVLDRYGTEYPPMVRGMQMTEMQAPVLTYPADGAVQLLPTFLTWDVVNGADSYFIEIATDENFEDIICYVERGEARFYTGDITLLEDGVEYWWRVTARGANAYDKTSEVRSFIGSAFAMVSPADGERDVALAPELRCDSLPIEGTKYVFEIARNNSFSNSYFVWKGESDYPRITIPDSVLSPATSYYVRASVTAGNMYALSTATVFRTLPLPVPTPVILYPHDGDVLPAGELTVSWQEQTSGGFRVELSTMTSFAPRVTKAVATDAFTFEGTIVDIDAGEYYLRVRATADADYVYSDTLKITLIEPTAVDDIWGVSDIKVRKIVNDGQIIILMPDGTRYTLLGIKIEE